MASVGRGRRFRPLGHNEEKTMSTKLDSIIRSRRFWLAVAGVAIAASEELGISIPPETIQQVVMLFAAWIVGDSLRKTE